MNWRHYDHEKLRQLRREKSAAEGRKISLEDVASALAAHKETISRAERGAVASYELLCQLADFYQVPVTSLLHPVPLQADAA
jgi:transcriptional regulator with XRE-family HTH domain